MSAMLTLPAEIISAIVSHLCEQDLASAATISRQWQPIVEAQSFRTVVISPWRASKAYAILPKRLSYIRNVQLVVALPSPCGSAPHAPFCSKMFSDILTCLFEIFKHRDDGNNTSNLPYTVSLTCRAPLTSVGSDNRVLPGLNLNLLMPLQVHEHVDASLPNPLPMLHGIKEFQANLWSDPIVYNPAPICRIAGFMPNLQTFSLSARDQSDNGDEKLKHRVALAESLNHLPQSLQDLSLHYDQTRPDFIPHPSQDAVTSDLGQKLLFLSRRPNLTSITLKGNFEDDMLWSQDDVDYGPDSWAQMQKFSLETTLTTLSGNYYLRAEEIGFMLDEDDDEDDDFALHSVGDIDSFTEVNKTVLEPALAKSAMLASQMPCLQEFNFTVNSPRHFRLTYTPGELKIYSHHVYEPGYDVLDAWAKVVKTEPRLGNSLRVRFESTGPRVRELVVEA